MLSKLGNILMAKARAFKDTRESVEAIVSYRKCEEHTPSGRSVIITITSHPASCVLTSSS
ncbi:hypothetical protein MD484_g1366, partial [Candolleomyces efflorescens]